MKTYNRNELLTLKAKIKGLAQEGARTHQILRTKKGLERDRYWCLKRQIGLEARHYLIAYALLRGKTFQEIEPKANLTLAQWKISAPRVADIMKLEKPYNGWTWESVREHIFPKSQKEAA